MSDPHPEIVIVRRHSSEEDAHHGGAWKIAFADFMTAMMAFFLVLWIISATDKNTKTIIARYFNPVKIEEPAKAQKGIKGAPQQNSDTPGDDSKAPKAEKPRPDPLQSPNPASEPAPASGAAEAKQNHPSPDFPVPPDPARPNPTMSEAELFTDPPGSLNKIAGPPPPGHGVDVSATSKGYGQISPSPDDALRDPFDPLGSDRAIKATPPHPGAPLPPSSNAQGAEPPRPEAPADHPAAGEATTPTPGPPPSRQPPPPTPLQASEVNSPAPQAVEARAQTAAQLLRDVRKRLEVEGQATGGPQLDIQASDEGVLISLTDRQNFSMFPIGSAEPQPHVIRMMDAIAMSLSALPGEIVVRGHTDGHPYRSKIYDNWRLSSARAQMAYYMLLRGGVPEKRFARIEGFADRGLKDPAHPFAPENRRIEILLRESK